MNLIHLIKTSLMNRGDEDTIPAYVQSLKGRNDSLRSRSLDCMRTNQHELIVAVHGTKSKSGRSKNGTSSLAIYPLAAGCVTLFGFTSRNTIMAAVATIIVTSAQTVEALER